jgi:hypothetical protein
MTMLASQPTRPPMIKVMMRLMLFAPLAMG